MYFAVLPSVLNEDEKAHYFVDTVDTDIFLRENYQWIDIGAR